MKLFFTQVKLSSRYDILRTGPAMCWIGTNTLAILTGELGVRCWDLHTGDSYVLSPPDSSTGNMATPQEICTSISFCKNNGTVNILLALLIHDMHYSETKS